jgi:anaerobic selenocysteine-containing dehydrogenase
MKETKVSDVTITKTLCPFCSFGCEFGIAFDDFGVKGVEYIAEGSSEGRLCPRGSAAALYLNHPKRSYMPMRDNKVIEWSNILKELKKLVAKPAHTAVTFDRNVTIEEYEAIVSFCKETKIETIASSYFEPETFLKRFLTEPFSIEEIDVAQMIVVIGDPFNQSPMLSKSLINWKLKDRKNRLVVIDSINTHTSVFATDFLKVKVGTEPLLLFALAQEPVGGIDVSSVTNIAQEIIDNVKLSFREASNGLLIASLPFAHTYDPLLLTEGLTRLSKFSQKKVVPFVEFAGYDGNHYFGSIIQSAKKKHIKHLINFGELFPFYYPQLRNQYKQLNIYATTPVKFNGYTTLPAAINLEKTGTILTTFGKKHIAGAIHPASGAKTVDEILSLVSEVRGKGTSLKAPEVKIDTTEQTRKLVERCIQAKKKKTFTLLGEKIAYNFLGLFEKEKMKMNPMDAYELGIKSNDVVSVKSKHGSVDIIAKLTRDVEMGVVVVPAETPEVKGLFDFEIDNNVVNFIPSEVEIWRRE